MADDPTKLVVDIGLPDRDALTAHIAEQVDATMQARRDGAITSEEAGARLAALADQDTSAAAIPDQVTIVPLDADELAQLNIDRQQAATQLDTARGEAMAELRAKRDRWLSQTDVLAVPVAALPVDLAAATKDAIAANQPAWLAFRQQLRDYPESVADPLDPPAFPEQPAAPAISLG